MARQGLGKGLSALISEKPHVQNQNNPVAELTTSEEASNNANSSQRREVLSISALTPGRFQPRSFFAESELQELSESIRLNGVIQPILVRPLQNNNSGYEIIAGERRFRAAGLAGLKEIPAIVMDVDDKQALEIGLIENIQRQNLTPIEEAEGYKRLIDEFSYTQEGLAEVLGKSRPQVTNMIRLLELPASVKNYLQEGKITAGHARALLSAQNPEAAANIVLKRGLSVRQTEQLVKQTSKPARVAKIPAKDEDLLRLEQLVSQKTGTEVSITNSGQSGKIIVQYHSLKQLDDLLKRLETPVSERSLSEEAA